MRVIPERLRGVITTRRYTNPRLPLPSLKKPMSLNTDGVEYNTMNIFSVHPVTRKRTHYTIIS